MIEARRVEALAQHGRDERGTPDVEPVDDAQHAESAHRSHTTDRRATLDRLHTPAIPSPGAASPGPTIRHLNRALLAASVARSPSASRFTRSRAARMWPLFAAVPALLVIGFVVARGPRACLAMLVVTTIFGLNVHAVGRPARLPADRHPLGGARRVDAADAGPGRPDPRSPGRSTPGRDLARCAAHIAVSGAGALTEWLRGRVRSRGRGSRRRSASCGSFPTRCARSTTSSSCSASSSSRWPARSCSRSCRRQRPSGSGTGWRARTVRHAPGLLGALLIAASFHAPVPRRRGVRTLFLVIGIAGLVLTKSVGSLAAAGVMLGLFGLRSVAERRTSVSRGLLTPAGLLLVALLALGFAATLRPGSLPGSTDLLRQHDHAPHRARDRRARDVH